MLAEQLSSAQFTARSYNMIIREEDLDAASAFSRVYIVSFSDGTEQLHALVRPDNFNAADFLEEKGFNISPELYLDPSGRLRFLRHGLQNRIFNPTSPNGVNAEIKIDQPGGLDNPVANSQLLRIPIAV